MWPLIALPALSGHCFKVSLKAHYATKTIVTLAGLEVYCKVTFKALYAIKIMLTLVRLAKALKVNKVNPKNPRRQLTTNITKK